ncbi:uncharacterized protein LOC134770812 [Penaeus indicus]|uniref:uncharacterized protein LOC134770812 n=1 Tax=Penaeus indicus TaxID=29960 RepID=UPI00300DBCE0
MLFQLQYGDLRFYEEGLSSSYSGVLQREDLMPDDIKERFRRRRERMLKICQETENKEDIEFTVRSRTIYFWKYNASVCTMGKVGSANWRTHAQKINKVKGQPMDEARRLRLINSTLDKIVNYTKSTSRWISVRQPWFSALPPGHGGDFPNDIHEIRLLVWPVGAYGREIWIIAYEFYARQTSKKKHFAESRLRRSRNIFCTDSEEKVTVAIWNNTIIPNDLEEFLFPTLLSNGLVYKFQESSTWKKYLAKTNTSVKNLDPKDERLRLSVTFTEFLRHVVHTFEAGGEIDKHWKTYGLLCSPCFFEYDYIAKVETHSEDLEYVFKKFRIRSNPHQAVKTKGNVLVKVSKDSRYYDTVPLELKEKIYNIYQIDMEMFGYDLPESYWNTP